MTVIIHSLNKKITVMRSVKRGWGGIEPPTSRTLNENHTTRPLPHHTHILCIVLKFAKKKYLTKMFKIKLFCVVPPPWLSWQSVRLLTDRSSVRSRVGAFFVEKKKSFWRKNKTPSVGIEPTAIGLKGQRSTIWAKKAPSCLWRILTIIYCYRCDQKHFPCPGVEPGSHGWEPCILTT